MELRITHKQAFWMLVLILSFSFLTQVVVGMGYINTYDTYWYRNWGLDAAENGLFTIYSRVEDINLDYPPLYLILLYITGLCYGSAGKGLHVFLQMFLMKFWPIFFNVACAALLYYICRKRFGRPTGLLAAFLWCMNPGFFFNAAMWGQSDSVMAFLLLVSFYLLDRDRPVAACVAFAVAGLTKFQSLFFTPPFLLVLVLRNLPDWKRIVKSLAAAAVTVAVVFIPFMVGGRNPMLFFDVYLGSANKYPYCSLHAYNFYSMLGLNWTTGLKDIEPIAGGFTWNHFSCICAALSVALVAALYILSYRRFGRARLDGWVGGFLMMQCLFMFMTRMHERYQVIVVPFALMAWLTTRNRRFLGLFAALSCFTCVNQAVVLLDMVLGAQRNIEPFWSSYSHELVIVLSFINMLLFVWSVYECVTYFLGSRRKDRTAGGTDVRAFGSPSPDETDGQAPALEGRPGAERDAAPALREDPAPAGGRPAERSHRQWIRI